MNCLQKDRRYKSGMLPLQSTYISRLSRGIASGFALTLDFVQMAFGDAVLRFESSSTKRE